jgi:hypothetical protein
VSNTGYTEDVVVELRKDSVVVGTLTKTVPAKGSYRTTSFVLTYTFTQDDSKSGTVTFSAHALFASGNRDANYANNIATAPPTKVK